jgi:hypothetical protein
VRRLPARFARRDGHAPDTNDRKRISANLKFVAQRYYAGAWRLVASDALPMDYDGRFYAYLITSTRGTYRMRTVFAGAADHLGDSSPWAYFQIR